MTGLLPCVHGTGMAEFLFSLLATVIAGVGARDQLLVAHMGAHQAEGTPASRPVLLLLALAAAIGSAAAAGWAGMTLGPLLVPHARVLLVALALGLAALELLFVKPGRRPEEPTASLGAFAIVLLANEVTDAARLLAFVLAANSHAPQVAAAGAILGCAVTVAAGWLAGPSLLGWPLVGVRRGLGLVLAAASVWLAI